MVPVIPNLGEEAEAQEEFAGQWRPMPLISTTWEAEAGESLSLWPAWLHRETLSQEQNKTKEQVADLAQPK